MTRLAFLTDVHADVHALADALVQIERLGCQRIVCAGDLVDYGLFPEETLALLRERKIPCIRGNHDRWALRQGRDTTGWDLSGQAMAFLERLPPSWATDVDGCRVVVWHARPRSDMDGIYPDLPREETQSLLEAAKADVLVVGHTHIPLCLTAWGGMIVNPGALLREPGPGKFMNVPKLQGGSPADPERLMLGAPGGTFGVLELPARRFTVHRARDGTEVEIIRR